MIPTQLTPRTQQPRWAVPYPNAGLGYSEAEEWKAAGRSINGPQTTEKLRAAIKRYGKPVRLGAASTWGAITKTVTNDSIRGGEVSEELRQAITRHYGAFTKDALAPAWVNALVSAGRFMRSERGYKALPDDLEITDEMLAAQWAWGDNVDHLHSWILTRAGQLITTWGNTEISVIRDLLHRAMMVDLVTSQKLAQLVKDTGIGLTRPQMRVQLAMLEALTEEGVAPNIIYQQMERYRQKQLRHRARTIARTEIAESYNRGLYESARAIEDTEDVDIWKRWWTATDERVCSICGPLHRQEVDLDENFDGAREHPTAHPRCRCTVQYFEKL